MSSSSPKLNFAGFIDLLKQTFTSFGEDKVARLASSLAYYTVFSISPLLIVLLGVAALVLRDPERLAQVQTAIQDQLQGNLGETASTAVREMMANAKNADPNASRPIMATIIGLLVSLWAASGLFGALQDSLNTIWGVAPRPDLGIMGFVRARFMSFAMVLGIGFLLVVSMIASAALSAASGWMNGFIGESPIMASAIDFGLGFFVFTLFFAAIFKILPDAEIKWHDVWIGAAVTAFLFSIGRLALAWYLGRSGVSSAYGSAGALIVLLLWVNYASTIMFAGAEFTKAYANKFGSKIRPSEHAIAVTDEARARQGLTREPTVAGVKPERNPSIVAKGAPQDPKKPVPAGDKIERAVSGASDAARKEFEFTLATVAGGIIAVLWFLRGRRDRD
jgi:membrane protein